MGAKEDDNLATKKQEEEGMDLKVKKYMRGDAANLQGLQDKKLRGQLTVREDLNEKSAKVAAKIEKWMLPSEEGYLMPEGIEKTWRIKQESIGQEVDILSARNQYDMVLPDFGPYSVDFTSSGRYMALGGRKGHLAILDVKNLSIIKELQVRETVRDVVFLHNELFFAAAQKKYPYIYNQDGTELHCLKEHGAVLKLQFLKNHFLLATINESGRLRYQDVTTGDMVGNYLTREGRPSVMEVNPFNNMIAVGSSRGKVSLWKPTTAQSPLSIICHQGPVTAMAFHSNGNLWATAGMERKVKLWDRRKPGVAVQTLSAHAKTLDFSQKGLLAAGTGSFVQIWRDPSGAANYERYMSHSIAKGYQIEQAVFRPYEDVLCIGHSKGWSSYLVPGSGEPNFDTWVANPFETPKQRREKEVRALLDKLPPETIMMDPTKIGGVRVERRRERPTKQEKEQELVEAIEAVKHKKVKKKTKGRSKPSKVARKKEEAVENAKRPFQEQESAEGAKKKKRKIDSEETELPKSLQRFAKKKAAA